MLAPATPLLVRLCDQIWLQTRRLCPLGMPHVKPWRCPSGPDTRWEKMVNWPKRSPHAGLLYKYSCPMAFRIIELGKTCSV